VLPIRQHYGPGMENTLKLAPAAEDWRLAREVYSHFESKLGSEHIAGESTLAHLSALLRTRTINSVLEFGSGIGTITYLLLKRLHQEARIVVTERHEWCRQQFDQNIPAAERTRVELFPEGRPEISDPFDLVIIDGPVSAGARFVREGFRLSRRRHPAAHMVHRPRRHAEPEL
jgi:predicted O-methyltransferase YrrM